MNKRNVLALALAAVMLLCVLTGCGKKEPLVKEIAGIDPETTVMTINGAPISAELYYYWLTIVCEDTALAIPKSATLTLPSFEISIF